MPSLYLGKAELIVCPGGTFGPVCAKSVHSVNVTAVGHTVGHTVGHPVSSVYPPSRRPCNLD